MLRTELVETSFDGHMFSMVRGEYETIETFNGEDSDGGDVLDNPVGIGTGMLAFIPGVYYVFFFVDEAVHLGMPWSTYVGPEQHHIQTLNPSRNCSMN